MATYRGLVPESFYRERSTAHGGRDWADLVRRQRAGGGEVLIARSYGGIDGLCQYGPTEDNDDDPLVWDRSTVSMSIRFANGRESVAHFSPERQPASKARGWSKSRCGFLRGTQERGPSTSIWVGSPMAAAGLTGPPMFATDGPCVKARCRFDRLAEGKRQD